MEECEFKKACLKWVMSDCTMEPGLCDYAKFAHDVRSATLGDPESVVSKWIQDYLNSKEHREQYANREELEKMIEKQNPRNIHSQNPSFMKGYAKMKKRALDIIRTFIPHGLEE